MAKIIGVIAACICFSFILPEAINLKENCILNAQAIDPFINKLKRLDSSEQEKVAILHIGDSHIQADILTGRVRTLFQERFGDAGRGFVFPYRIANTMGARDVKFKYSGTWQSENVMKRQNHADIGASGYRVMASPNCNISLAVPKDEIRDQTFNKITLFTSVSRFMPHEVEGDFQFSMENGFPVFTFDQYQTSLSLNIVNSDSQANESELLGMILENGCAGVLYHAMGVNGSSTLQYSKAALDTQIRCLNPDLVILSFGTNDCYVPSSSFCAACVKDRYKKIIARIRSASPQSSILITAPSDHYYKRKYSNPNLVKLRSMLDELIYEENLAYWDLYEIMGGRSSMRAWYNSGLASSDLVHFTKEGYKLQGDLLYSALKAEMTTE